MALLGTNAFASPITMDVLSAPDGLTILNKNATLSLPTGYVTESILTQTNVVSNIAGKSFADTAAVAKQVKCFYDFSVSGGATGADIDLKCAIPPNSVVNYAYMDVITSLTGNTGAMVSVSVNGASEITRALLVNSTNYASGQYILTPRGATSGLYKFSGAAATEVYLNIRNAALTAGKLNIWVDYLISN